jgi:hypothetical protein
MKTPMRRCKQRRGMPQLRRRPSQNSRLNGIPVELQQVRAWVVWRDELIDGAVVRLFFNPATGAPASLDDPSSWGSYAEARAAFERGCAGPDDDAVSA